MPLKYGRLKKGVYAALTGISQQRITDWLSDLDVLAKQKQDAVTTQETVINQLLPKLAELHDKGLSYREIAEKIGISHATIARYVKIYTEKQQHVADPSQ